MSARACRLAIVFVACATTSCAPSLPATPDGGGGNSGTGGTSGTAGTSGTGGTSGSGGTAGRAGASGAAGAAGASGGGGTAGTGTGVAGMGGAAGTGGAAGMGGAGGAGNQMWRQPTTVASGMSPQVAMGGSSAALVWLALETKWLVEASGYAEGAGWDPAVHIQSEFAGSLPMAAAPKVAMNAHGVTLATWTQQGNGEQDAAFNFLLPGTGWSSSPVVSGIDLSVSAGGTSPPVVAIGANDLGEWLIGGQSYIRAVEFLGNGTSLPGGTVSNAGNVASCPSVAVNGRGAAMAVWTEKPSSGSWLNTAWFYDPDQSQSQPPVTIGSGDPNALGCPKVAIDDLGRAFAVWTVTSAGVSSLAYRSTDLTQSWGSGPTTIALGGLSAFNPDLSLSPSGEGLVAWEQSTTASASSPRDIRAVHLQLGRGLDPAGALPVGATAPASDPRVVVTRAGTGVVVWVQGGRIWSSPLLETTTTFGQQAPIDTVRNLYTSQNPDLATDGNGRALAAWESTSGGVPDIVVARFE